MAEGEIGKRIMLRASELGKRLFRNNTAMGWAGKVQINHEKDGSLTAVVRKAHPLHAGLCVGSSDLIGFTPTIVTQEMVGRVVAVFTAVEVKDGTKPTPEQLNFIEQVKKAGGIAGIAHSVDEFEGLLNG